MKEGDFFKRLAERKETGLFRGKFPGKNRSGGKLSEELLKEKKKSFRRHREKTNYGTRGTNP